MIKNKYMNALYIVIPIFALWFAYLAIDRLGLESKSASVVVKDKKFERGGTTYAPTAAPINPAKPSGGLSMPVEKSDMYILYFNVNGSEAAGLVTPNQYGSINEGDTVNIKYTTTRISKHLIVTEVVK
jgi:hypothetical protein